VPRLCRFLGEAAVGYSGLRVLAGNFTRAAFEAAPLRAEFVALRERLPERVVQFAGWFVLGVVAFLVELGLLAITHQLMHWPLWIASAVAAELVLLSRFLSTDRLVFGYRRPSFGRCWRFHAAAAGSFLVSWVVLNGSADLFGVQYALAAFLGTVAAFLWSCVTNFLWVWRASPTPIVKDRR
jgi:putative flippase GtrA